MRSQALHVTGQARILRIFNQQILEDSDNLRIFASPVNAAADCAGASFYPITATKLNVFFVAKR